MWCEGTTHIENQVLCRLLKHDAMYGTQTLKVYMWCVLSANIKPVDGVPTGSFLTSRESAAKALGVNQQVYRSAIKYLTGNQLVTSGVTSGVTTISICNYDKIRYVVTSGVTSGVTSKKPRVVEVRSTPGVIVTTDSDVSLAVEKKLEETTEEPDQKTDPVGIPKPPAKHPDQKELDNVKNYILKDLDLYLDCPVLNTVDPRTGHVAIYKMYRRWRDAYRNIDVIAQIRSAHSWEASHRKKQPKARPGFLDNWMRRQNWQGNWNMNVHDDQDRVEVKEVDENVKRLVGLAAAGTKMF